MSEPANVDPQTLARLAIKRDRYRDALKRMGTENAQLKEQIANLAAGLDAAKKAAPPERVAELEGELRRLRHKHVFDRLARERGASDDVLDDLYDLLKYQPEGDKPDEKAIAALLDEAADHPARSRFFASWDDADDEGTEPDRPAPADREVITPGRQPGPGRDRGGAHQPAKSGVVVTRAQLADPKFALDPRNRELIAAAAKEGRIRDA